MTGTTPPSNAITRDHGRLEKGTRLLLLTLGVLLVVMILGLILGAPTEDGPAFADLLYNMGLAGIVGFGTNWIAIRMLFHPYQRTFGVQGVIPRKREELSRRAAELMEDRLISGHRLIEYLKRQGAIAKIAENLGSTVESSLDGPEFRERALDASSEALCSAAPAIVARLKVQIDEKVKEAAGMFASFAAGMIDKLAESVEAKMVDQAYIREILIEADVDFAAAAKKMLGPTQGAESMVEAAIDALLANLKIADLIEEELAKQSIEEFEEMVDDAANSELVFLQVAGGGLGALAGLAMLWPWLLFVYGGAFGVAMLAPRFRRKPKITTYYPSDDTRSESE